MKLHSEGKIDENGKIFSDELITEKQGYEAMLLMLYNYWKSTDSNDLTDILSGGEYWLDYDIPADSAFWEYWLEAVDKIKKNGFLKLKKLSKE
ncbi:hypothetical protein SAMN05444377_10369 [Flavobacterium fontis]|uniref:Uncharacterized protein n=1 Tax=Flavobacterium fontis TaxID=1124188 RepID=A0A1M4YE50_9FLAO|nr:MULTISPECIES: hypothetical protein [Flavobacterium]MCZ8298346.1 hypothetical protein [Flavobacterium sp.]SHF04047.1 hypothetical protein SAMN05444377_10369 [Flavobacterium fontis]